jgi:hypothetical protein
MAKKSSHSDNKSGGKKTGEKKEKSGESGSSETAKVDPFTISYHPPGSELMYSPAGKGQSESCHCCECSAYFV